jgi:hypothetical protein
MQLMFFLLTKSFDSAKAYGASAASNLDAQKICKAGGDKVEQRSNQTKLYLSNFFGVAIAVELPKY